MKMRGVDLLLIILCLALPLLVVIAACLFELLY
jgi:hypothetical protein